MVEESATRKLVAILAADLVGYSRLVGEDEEGTLARLRALRTSLVDPKIGEHRGRIVKTTGDGLLVEFSSVVDAVRAAVEIQAGARESERDTAEDQRLQFRIGINLGDVVEQDGDLLGDGVNVAARLEGLADPGGICLSRAARDQVRDRMEIALEDMGEVEVKNIARPLRAFRVLVDGAPARNPHRQVSTQTVGSKRLDYDLKVSGLWMLPVVPGMAVLGWFIGLESPGALFPLLGVAALLACISIGLLAASKIIERRNR